MSDLHDLAVLYVVDALEADEAREFKDHLAGCAECQLEVREMSAVTADLSRSVEATPPASLRAAILAQIAETPQESPTAQPHVSAPGLGQRNQPRSGSNVVELASRRPSRLPYLVAAASVLLAVGFGGWALQSRQDVTEAHQQYTSIAELLATPDVRTASRAVSGGGSATLVLSRAQARAVFVAEDMPSLDDGQVYELWTFDRGATPAGTFTPADEPAVVDLPTAALSASRVMMTVEPSGGSKHPTGRPIMSVDVPPSA